MGYISKEFRGVYNMLCSTIPETKILQPLILFRIFSFSEVKNTGNRIHILVEKNMG